MNVLDRYLARVVLTGTALALLVLVSIDAFFAFVGETGDIGLGDYGVGEAFRYVALTLPRRVYDLLTMALLLGSLMGLGTLASNSELVAIRAAGVPIASIIRAVLQAGLVVLVLGSLIGEFVVPPAEQYAQSQRSIDMSQRITFKSDYGFWARDGNSFIHIEQILPGDRLGGIRVYAFDEQHRLIQATKAEQAYYRDGQWLLEDVRQSSVDESGVETAITPAQAWDSLLSPDLLNVVVVKPENLSGRDLFRYVRYLEANELDSQRYRLAFWGKLTAPLGGVVMLFLAVPFVFGPLRSVGAGQRLLVGVMAGFGFFLLNQTMSHMGQVYQLDPLVSVLVAPMLFFTIGLIALRRFG